MAASPGRHRPGDRDRLPVTYVLPLRRDPVAPATPASRTVARAELDDLIRYLHAVAGWVDDPIVVDGSPPATFAEHDRLWREVVRHIAPDRTIADPPDKVSGVVTGARRARHAVVVVADDDVRWSRRQLADALMRMTETEADLLRPQNRFDPSPWHARWDTGRTLVNRAVGGDWPGTIVVRREAVAAGYGYGVMFENLDLHRTVRARGGRTALARDLVVVRRPPSVGGFAHQRVRQAYDEIARPWRLAWQLAIVPLAVVGGRRAIALMAAAAVATAEVGRRRGGRQGFPPTGPLWAPAWLAERGLCAWLALGARARGGVRYRGRRVRVAARPVRAITVRPPAPGG